MHETCDSCGKQFELLDVVFTGRQCLCVTCYEARQPSNMGLAILAEPVKADSP